MIYVFMHKIIKSLVSFDSTCICFAEDTMKSTAAVTELTNDAPVTSHHDVTTTSFWTFQQQQPVAVDVGNNVEEVMAGISDNDKDMHGTKT